MQRAEREIIKHIQKQAFGQEIAILKSWNSSFDIIDRKSARARNATMKKSSSLYRLDPFSDENGLLRVGGRANLPDELKHPYILPRNGHLAKLIICHHHRRIGHQGRGMTHNEIRSPGIWIIGGRSAVSSYILKCVKFRKLRAGPQQQKMADLPEDRLEPSPPFTYSAVDFFGPWLVKEGRREVKRYGVLFTCIASREIHVETAISLETSSFINAYRRFVSRRGPVRQLRSDRGTNFVGCKNELQAALREMDQEKIRSNLLECNCDWVNFQMNVPHASHMGGVWERQIRSVRNVLDVLLDNHGSQLNGESLRTLLIEAEAILNSRPLAPECSDTLEPLTPSLLLTQKSRVLLPPPGKFSSADLYSRRRWRRVQHLANEFWGRWRKEFLQVLQTRQKWIKPSRNLRIGEIVLLKEDDAQRNCWRLARVDKTYPSLDGLVRKVRIAIADPALDDKGRRGKS